MNQHNRKFLCAVVLYHPADNVIENIKSYASYIDGLIIIDNSEPTSLILSGIQNLFPQSIIIKNEENVGIAKALNQAATYAVENGFEWLLTMDQDSYFADDSISKLIEATNKDLKNVGLYTPVHVTKDTVIKPWGNEHQQIKKTMTSGNLLNINAYAACGPFEEKLFIDYVDHEYNFRLQKKGYKLIRVNSSHLIHNLGNIQAYKYLFLRMKTTNHNAIRRYYITRNRLFVIFKYFSFAPKFFFKEIHQYWTDCIRILLLEKNKAEKIKAVMLGTFDWLLGRYGKRNQL